MRGSFSPRRRVVALATVALAAASCVAPVSGSGAGPVRPVDASAVQGPIAAKGQRFVVALDQPIDTLASVQRGYFTAHLVSPLLASDGSVLAPAGATVEGTIRSLGAPEAPRVRLRFDRINTVHGPSPLPAKVRWAQYRMYLGPVVGGVSSGRNEWGWNWGPTYPGPMQGWNVNGDPYSEGGFYDMPYRAREVHLPAGAHLELELTHPLVSGR